MEIFKIIQCIGFIFLYLVSASENSSSNDKNEKEIKSGKDVHIIPGIRRAERIIMAPVSYNPYVLFNYPEPGWKALATLIPDNADSTASGIVIFHQWSPHNFIRVNINATGFPPGKHAVHIHAFGDLSGGCKTTGPHVQSNFIGNVEADTNGAIITGFFSAFLTMFGYHGIIGRSVVIHTKPIEVNLHPDAFTAQLQISPASANTVSFQTEENSVGPPIACGAITITDTLS